MLYIVLGGFLDNVEDIHTLDLERIDFVGVFPNKKEAQQKWKAVSQRDVDQAHKRYFIIPVDKMALNRLS